MRPAAPDYDKIPWDYLSTATQDRHAPSAMQSLTAERLTNKGGWTAYIALPTVAL